MAGEAKYTMKRGLRPLQLPLRSSTISETFFFTE
jgi:hypothetical protein